jgi:DNA-binding transcriptional ArsR family regulator
MTWSSRPRKEKEKTDLVLAALAAPVRRRILDELDTDYGRAIYDLCKVVPLSRQGVRKHLVVLFRARLVIPYRVNSYVVHFIDPRPMRRTFVELFRRYRRDLRPFADFMFDW